MERRQDGRLPIGNPATASLWLGTPRERVVLCDVADVSAGGARLRIVDRASELRSAVGDGRPCRLEVDDLGSLIAVPRWLRSGPDGERFLGAVLQGPEAVAPLASTRVPAVGEVAAVSWAGFFARRALLLHLARKPEEAFHTRRRALRQATAFVERTLQHTTLGGTVVPSLEEESAERFERELAAADDLSRLGVWTGAADAVFAAATLRVVAHLARGSSGLDEALDAQERVAASSTISLARWSAGALRALAEQRPALRAKAAAAALARSDVSELPEAFDGFPAASLIGVLSAALAVVPFVGVPRSRSGRERSRRGRGGRGGASGDDHVADA